MSCVRCTAYRGAGTAAGLNTFLSMYLRLAGLAVDACCVGKVHCINYVTHDCFIEQSDPAGMSVGPAVHALNVTMIVQAV